MTTNTGQSETLMHCRWIKDSEVPGGKFHVPGCYGAAVYGPDKCTCNVKRERKSLEDRLAKLEEAVRRLEKSHPRGQSK